MEKSNFKKMALMGMAGGMLLASQSPISPDNAGTVGTYLAGGCGAHGCNSSGNYQNRNSCGNRRGYTADATAEVQTQAAQTKPLTEAELLPQLNEQGKAAYQKLSPEGKALALSLASQIKDKNEAVKQAAQKIAEKHNGAGVK